MTARATERYAVNEGRACGYCHVSGSPGFVDVAKGRREPLDLNFRGTYYAKHDHTFNGFVEPNALNAGPPTMFKFVERLVIPESARRCAVADTVGDRVERLILLTPKAESKTSSTLTIKRWSGNAFITEFETDTPGVADKLAVGKYTPEGRTVILTSNALWYWNGKTYMSKTSPNTVALVGTLHYRTDATEQVLAVNGAGELVSYRVNLAAGVGTDYLANGTRLTELPAGQVSYLDLHQTAEGLEKIQAGLSQLSKGGIMGLWSPAPGAKQMLYHVDLDQDVEIKNDTTKTQKITVKSEGWKVGVIDPRNPALATTFFTPRLAGEVYDLGTVSPYDGASGLLILTSEGPDKKGRSLYYFAYNTGKK